MNSTNAIKAFSLLLSSALLLSACGGGGDSSPETLTGVFIDAPVTGAGFQTASGQGTTNDKGEFTYLAGETVSFFLQGIEIGSTQAQETLPVTKLPNPVVLAQILQTLDHNSEPGKIDVSGLVLDDALKAQLKSVILNEEGAPALDTVLTDTKLAEIEAASSVDLVNETLVSESEAASHLADNIDPIAFTASDFANKFIVDSDGSGLGSDLGIFNFDAQGSGTEADEDSAGVAKIESVSWSLNDDGTFNFVNGDGQNFTITKLSESDNRTIVHIKDLSNNEESIREVYEALPLSLADLEGKHFALDMSDDPGCTAMTISFEGANMVINESCDDGFFSETGTVSEHNQLENVIIVSFPASGGEPASEAHFALVEGNLANGKYGLIGYEGSEIDDVDIFSMAETDTALVNTNVIKAEDMAGKLFVEVSGDLSVINPNIYAFTFDAVGNNGEAIGRDNSGSGFVDPFSWSANDDGTATLVFSNRTSTGTQISQSGNKRVIRIEESDGDVFNRDWYEAMPLSLADLDGKHFSIGDIGNCTGMTWSFNGAVVDVAEQCPGDFETYTIQASEHSEFEDVITLVEEYEVLGTVYTEISHLALIEGSIASGKFASVEYTDSDPHGTFIMPWDETDAALTE